MRYGMNQTLKNNQQGLVLVMALIMLLLVTVIGVSAVRMSNVDTQLAGNSMYSIMVFHGAESALGKSASSQDWSNIPAAAVRSTTPVAINSSYLPPEVITGGGTLNSSGTMIFERILDGPVFNGVANSSEFTYQVFRVSAQSSLAATAAKDRHTEGRAAQIPKQ